ncbi:DUF898 domain-containing protein [Methylobacterium sp. WL30]|uniref:DUF898 family protein n=2 Tax=Methylobacterium TaxID=407 RepID=UPI0011C97E70|nr:MULTISPECIES: DUF898 family protein [unclassified Methylobacterium]TXN39443.1 DUF898 domain-containing protein [Methylobacterium sp. WL93]TXN52901.1 DUF898 domain-containing protein [Methylobacterium sp. WL119]TXN70574.1 DUF898 domain-containing protein [Methylobacterium sp. WL30]
MSRTGQVAFDTRLRGLTGLAIVGFLLSLVTFGVYRFWYMTDLRRFFWSRTVVDGSPADYTGTGRELFLGFLAALGLLIVIYVGLFGLAIALPSLAPYSAILSFVILFLLGQFAIYRGRRYRAMRTLWRGIRLGQDGSGLAYAGRAALWWALTLATLGLAFPFMRAGLERYRIAHTLIGTSRMASDARGRALFGPWLLFYAVALGPVLALLLALIAANDFVPPIDLMLPKPGGKGGDLILNPAYAGTRIATLAVALGITAGCCLPLSLLLVPFYRARETRVFMNAARLGPVRLVSTLRARQFYWPYLVYALSLLGFVVVVGLIALLAGLAARAAGGDGLAWAAVLGGGLLYLGGALAFAVLYVRVVQARLWAAVATTTQVADADGLNRILAASHGPGSGLNEGLADALDVGGALQIGF